jgi:hypothetical protein
MASTQWRDLLENRKTREQLKKEFFFVKGQFNATDAWHFNT